MFEIIVREVKPNGETREGYRRTEAEEVYTQKVESLDLISVIAAVNSRRPIRLGEDQSAKSL